MPVFSREELRQFESVLYEPKLEELVARQIATPNTSFASFVNEIGYKWYSMTGEVDMFAAGTESTVTKYVGEKGGSGMQRVFEMRIAVRYTRDEQNAMAAQRQFGNGPSVNLDTLRVKSARRFLAEEENKLFFYGDSENNHPGLLTADGTTKDNVATGASSKRTWKDKTPAEILQDILTAKEKIEGNGLFKAKVLVLTPSARLRLLKPYSDNNPMTVLNWLQSEGAYFNRIVETNSLMSKNTGLKISTTAVDCFVMLDNDPEVIELGLPLEIEMLPEYVDAWQSVTLPLRERTAGAIIRHPEAIYIGLGI